MDWLTKIDFSKLIEAASEPLGIMALVILVLSLLAYFFFGREGDWRVRMAAFVMLLVSFVSFAFAVNEISVVKSSTQKEADETKNAAITPPPPADPCKDVDITYDKHGPTGHAFWCGTNGATRTLFQQAAYSKTPSCFFYAQKPYAMRTQNQLWEDAVSLAKQGKDDEAMELLDACQCHNPNSQTLQKLGRQQILCFMKAQPR